MTKNELIAKKALYEAKKVELSLDNGDEQIELKVAEYRQQLKAEYDAAKQDDIKKLDNYLELLDELISEQDAVETEVEQTIANDTASESLDSTM